MGNTLSSAINLFSNAEKPHTDLLIVYDEYDNIQKCMHGIEDVFKTSQLIRTKRHSIFDPDEDKVQLRCDKVLIIINGTGAEHKIEEWKQGLPDIKDDHRKCLVLN